MIKESNHGYGLVYVLPLIIYKRKNKILKISENKSITQYKQS